MIAFDKVLFIKGALLRLTNFFFTGACGFKISMYNFSKSSQLAVFVRLDSADDRSCLNKISSKCSEPL